MFMCVSCLSYQFPPTCAKQLCWSKGTKVVLWRHSHSRARKVLQLELYLTTAVQARMVSLPRVIHWGPFTALFIVGSVTITGTYTALQLWSLPQVE